MEPSAHRLSESPLWQWQRNYFARQGVLAWSRNVVPDFATNNAFAARNFARLVRARLQDYVDSCPSGEAKRVYILEAGAGSGRFAFRFLHFLHASPLPCPVTYVLTDFTESILEFWRSHPRLQDLLKKDWLDIALYDAESNSPIRLEYSGIELGPNSLESPLMLIGNYFLDSLPHDLFRMENGQLQEGRVQFSAPEEEGGVGLDQVVQSVRYVPAPDPVYAAGDAFSDKFNRILARYQKDLPNGTFTFPVAGIRSLDFLSTFSERGCFFLTADKGPNLLDALQSGRHDEIDKHGAVSVSVNFHALARWVETCRGRGRVWQQDHPYMRLNVLAFQLGDGKAPFHSVDRVYQEAISDFGPDDFVNMKDEMLARKDEISATALFSFLRLSNWDPEMVLSFYTRLARLLPGQTASVREAFAKGFVESGKLNYSLNPEIRFDFLLGGLCASVEEYGPALRMYAHAIRSEGEKADTIFNAALCLARMGQSQECISFLNRAAKLGVPQEEIDMVMAEI